MGIGVLRGLLYEEDGIYDTFEHYNSAVSGKAKHLSHILTTARATRTAFLKNPKPYLNPE